MEQDLFWQIHKLAFSLEKQADEALRLHLDIGFAQYKVLEAIHQNELVKQNTIASLLNQTEAGISRQIKILQKRGLINANTVMGNKRAKELSLTRVGDDIVRQSAEVLSHAHGETLASLSYQEQRILVELLLRIDN